jgi:hypothetical protein
MLHYLRIAVTALSVMACVLLVALWVRSHWKVDFVGIPLSRTKSIGIALIPGHVWWRIDEQPATWRLYTASVDEHRRTVDAAVGGFQYARGFRFSSDASCIPYWFLLVMTAVLTGVPWIKWRFSLRTLLIATTLVAVGLAVIVVTM